MPRKRTRRPPEEPVEARLVRKPLLSEGWYADLALVALAQRIKMRR